MHPEDKEKIPLFKSWRQWYWLVIILLLAQIVFYNWLTRTYS